MRIFMTSTCTRGSGRTRAGDNDRALSEVVEILFSMPDVPSAITRQVARMHDLLDSMLGDAVHEELGSSAQGQNDRLRALLIRCEQLKNVADATQALVMTEMGREALALDAAERGNADRPIRSHEEFVPDEISVLLSCTKTSAALRYGIAWQADRHAPIGQAWRDGAIDARKVSVIAEQIQVLDPTLADQLAVQASQFAARRTATQTREWLRRKVLAIDPASAERRRKVALADRRVVITPASDGMSELWAWLPSIAARAASSKRSPNWRTTSAGSTRARWTNVGPTS